MLMSVFMPSKNGDGGDTGRPRLLAGMLMRAGRFLRFIVVVAVKAGIVNFAMLAVYPPVAA